MMISDEEARALILLLLKSRGEQGAAESEMCVILDWAHQARTNECLLDLALQGKVDIDVVDGEPYFRAREADL